MKAKMMRAKLKNQFAAVLLWLRCFLFGCTDFSLCREKFFFALLRADTPGR